jgi:hypothetical protein
MKMNNYGEEFVALMKHLEETEEEQNKFLMVDQIIAKGLYSIAAELHSLNDTLSTNIENNKITDVSIVEFNTLKYKINEIKNKLRHKLCRNKI